MMNVICFSLKTAQIPSISLKYSLVSHTSTHFINKCNGSVIVLRLSKRENSSSMSSEKYQIEENKIDVDVEKSQNEKNESEKKQLLSEEFLLDLQMIAAIVFILMLTGVILFVKVFLKNKLL